MYLPCSHCSWPRILLRGASPAVGGTQDILEASFCIVSFTAFP